jgi:hypothetical protein
VLARGFSGFNAAVVLSAPAGATTSATSNPEERNAAVQFR